MIVPWPQGVAWLFRRVSSDTHLLWKTGRIARVSVGIGENLAASRLWRIRDYFASIGLQTSDSPDISYLDLVWVSSVQVSWLTVKVVIFGLRLPVLKCFDGCLLRPYLSNDFRRPLYPLRFNAFNTWEMDNWLRFALILSRSSIRLVLIVAFNVAVHFSSHDRRHDQGNRRHPCRRGDQ